MKFSPYYPIKGWHLNQGWGTYDPADYEQFGFSRHNGVDIALGTDSLVRAPYDGHIYQIGNQPTGGGIFIGFISDEQYDFEDFSCMTPDNISIPFAAMTSYVLMDFLHLKSVIGQVGVPYKAGDILAVQDNTGFSTGSHTHIQPRRVSYDGKQLDTLDINTAHNSFDPTLFWNGEFSEDIAIVPIEETIVTTAGSIVQQVGASTISNADKLSLLTQIQNLIKQLPL